MRQAAHTEELFRELDYRESDGIEVSLLWNPETGDLSVYVTDRRTEDALEFAVDAGEIADAFAHPFAYASRRHALVALPELAEIAA